MRLPSSLAILMLIALAATAAAAPLPVANHGFEELYFGSTLPAEFGGDVPPTAFPVGPAPSGWSAYGAVGGGAFIGVLNPGIMADDPLATYFPAGAPEGDNVALTFFDQFQGGAEFGIEQTLAATLEPRTVYRLTVDVGNIASGISSVPYFAAFGNFDLRGFPGYRIELLAGGSVIAQDAGSLLPDEGEFLPSTIEAVIGDDHPQLGQPLAIRLVNRNEQDVNDPVVDLEVDFDNVRLDAAPLSPADFNADGMVDGDDLAAWQLGFGVGSTPAAGNANGDADVDGDDFLVWQRQMAIVTAGPTTGAAPEPTGAWMLIAAAFAVGVARSFPRLKGAAS